MTIKTRFAPSPTGFLHVGGARTALYAWLYAKHAQGEFVLRIEDTDLERSTPEAITAILEGMTWLGLNWDEGPYYQTKRFERYNAIIDQWLLEGKAYRCYCSKERLETLREGQMASGEKPRYDGHCHDLPPQNGDMPHVIRFRNPKTGSVCFTDKVRGTIEVANSELDDLIIRRTDGSPTYNFCVVIDDWDMGITQVIRGEDHINNTPRQINMYHALGATVPEFAHVSMILGDDGTKLSKRHGAVSVMQYRDDGYLPEALLNYLVRLGWSHGDQEIFSRDEMIALFSLDSISKSASAFNTDKLKWLNNHYLRHLPPAQVATHLQWHLDNIALNTTSGPAITTVIPLLAERCHTLVELAEQCRYFYADEIQWDTAAQAKHLTQKAKEPLALLREKLCTTTEWTVEKLHQHMQDTAQELGLGMGKVGMPLRVAITGNTQSPSMDQVLYVLGQSTCLTRLDRALQHLVS